MSKDILIDALEGGIRQQSFADWQFRPLSHRFGANRFKVKLTSAPPTSGSSKVPAGRDSSSKTGG